MPSGEDRDPPKPLNRQTAIFFANQLREARLAALANAEAFGQIIHAVERLGSYIEGKQLVLAKYRDALVCLAEKSGLAEEIPNQFRGLLTPFCELYELVRIARNDASHQGAFARHLTKHAIEWAIILEDALGHYMEPQVSDFMVRNPICAELWQPISFIRQQMLANSFSYMPVHEEDEAWSVVSDVAIARFLGSEREGTTRNQRLAMTLGVAREDGLIILKRAETFEDKTSLDAALDHLSSENLLLVGGPTPGILLGILTAFDLL